MAGYSSASWAIGVLFSDCITKDTPPPFTSPNTTFGYTPVEKVLPDLRPGMTAEVEILVTELDNVLSVPIQALLLFDDKTHVAVKKPDGGIEWREVTLGAA